MAHYGGGWFSYLKQSEDQKMTFDRELLLRVWRFGTPYLGQIAGLMVTILVITGLTLLNPLIMRDLIDNTLPNGDTARLNWLALALVAIPIANGLVGVVQRRLSSQVGEGVIYDLRRALYDHMQRMSLRFFTQTRTGELMSRMNSDVVGAQGAVTWTLTNMTANIVTVIGTLTIMFALEWRLTLISLMVLPAFVILARRIGKTLRRIRRRSMEANAEMNAIMNETLNVSGALLVKLFGREKHEMGRFGGYAEEVRDIGVQSAVISRWFFMGLGIATALGTALVYWIGGYMTIQGQFTIGTIVAFGSYLGQLYGPLSALSNLPVEFAQSMVSFERVFEVLDIPVEIQELEKAETLVEANGLIEFEKVHFSYQVGQQGLAEIERFSFFGGGNVKVKRGKEIDGDVEEEEQEAEVRLALNDINFQIKPGQLAAIVGPSGAGKTTMTYLLPRLYDPTGGRVMIDGRDIKELTLESLADNIGMVTQETYLFYDTVRANLLYARQDATEAEMIAAAKAANIHDFVDDLPDGYDTVVGERGYRLSGGERQRIAIARVILKDPRILVLDEATSSLDSLSEALIQEALQRVMKGRTSLVIAHRLSTILAADVILVMDHGRLAEKGTHPELLAQGGLYNTLYETQFSAHLAQP